MIIKSFSPFPVFITERLTLRQLTTNDEQEIFMLRSDSQVNKYLGRQLANTIDDARNFINKVNENVTKDDSLYWAITFTENNRLVGTICLFEFSDENDSCEIGYELLPDFQGKGIMTEAVDEVIDYAFDTMKVKQIRAFFHRNNQNSIRLLEKFSFRDSSEPDNTNADLLYYHLYNLK
jgi:ribosomal-protein-alanine N-acetyltransferase